MIYIVIITLIIIVLIKILNKNQKENFSNLLFNEKNNINSIHKYFDEVYVITIPKRKEYIRKVMEKLKIKPIFFNAKLKDELNKEQLIKDNFIVPEYEGGDGRIACHYSHMSALKLFLDSGKDNCFIFEDDLKENDMPLDLLNNIIDKVMNNIPSSYEIIYFGRCWDKCEKQNKIADNLVRTYFPQCRHAYGVSRNGAKIITENAYPMIIGGGDKIIANMIDNNKLEAYAITPPIFFQNREDLGSNLANTDSLRECRIIRNNKRGLKKRRKRRKKKNTKKIFKSMNIFEGFTDNQKEKINKKTDKSSKSSIISNIYAYFNKKDVIMTTYFCKNKDIHHDQFAPCEDIRYIGNWYFSIKKLKLNGIVFHDSLSKDFVKKYETQTIKFIYIDSSKFTHSLNDQRFLIFYDYINKNKEINNIFLTDGNDITVRKNPFEYIDNKNIYIGSEENTIEDKLDWFNKECVKDILIQKLVKIKDKTILNAGIVGGKREILLNFLKRLNNVFNLLEDKDCNINMIVMNIVGHNTKNKKYGGKLNSRFKFYENFREDVYFIHK